MSQAGAGRRRGAGRGRARRSAPGEVGAAPSTPEELHAWVREHLGVWLVRGALVPGHSSPFEYVCWSYFEGREAGESGGEAAGREAVTDGVVWANRGGGKTFLGAVASLLDAVFKPGVEVRVLAGSLEQGVRMHEHLRRLLERPSLSGLVRGRATARAVRLRNGSGVEILAASQTSVRGTRVQKVRCDEVDLFPRELWEAAQLTTRSVACPGPWGPVVHGSIQALSTMHVPHGLMWELAGLGGAGVGEGGEGGVARRVFRWGVADVLERCPERRACAGCGLWDPCAGRAKARAPGEGGHVRIDDALRARARVSAAVWASEMLCLRPRRTGLVLPEFDAGVHVIDQEGPMPTAGSPDRVDGAGSVGAVGEGGEGGVVLVAGMDFGVRSACVVLLATLDAAGVVRVLEERSETGVGLEAHVAWVRGVCGARGWGLPSWVGIDPAGESRSEQTGVSNATVLRRAGLVVRARRLGLGAGLELMRRRLEGRAPEGRAASGAGGEAARGPRLLVHRRCRVLIESLSRYRYPADRPESLEPVKDGSDHAVDALRYLVINVDRTAQPGRRRYT